MEIKIRTQKTLDGTQECRQISELQAAERESLPPDYFKGPLNVFLDSSGKKLLRRVEDDSKDEVFLEIGDQFSEGKFQEKLKFIRKAAQRLDRIRLFESTTKPGWNGEEIFVM